LVPTLQPGDIVIMDNLGSHRGKAVRRAIRAAGARLFYLPKYSPDLNPIEQFFAKLKHWLRKSAQRTVEAVYDAIGLILRIVKSAECANYFRHPCVEEQGVKPSPPIHPCNLPGCADTCPHRPVALVNRNPSCNMRGFKVDQSPMRMHLGVTSDIGEKVLGVRDVPEKLLQ
jgi:transposase